MYKKASKKGMIQFCVKPSIAAKAVEIAGDFNKWKPVSMKKMKDGSFAADIPLGNGTYEYKFIVDGQWMADPDNHAWSVNQFGTLNSVARLE